MDDVAAAGRTSLSPKVVDTNFHSPDDKDYPVGRWVAGIGSFWHITPYYETFKGG